MVCCTMCCHHLGLHDPHRVTPFDECNALWKYFYMKHVFPYFHFIFRARLIKSSVRVMKKCHRTRGDRSKNTLLWKKNAAFDLFSSFSHHVIHSSSDSKTLWRFAVVYSQPFSPQRRPLRVTTVFSSLCLLTVLWLWRKFTAAKPRGKK